ncbi:hypothetical protein CYMTET_25910, partial [Cymbomonas tetramitiformis]
REQALIEELVHPLEKAHDRILRGMQQMQAGLLLETPEQDHHQMLLTLQHQLGREDEVEHAHLLLDAAKVAGRELPKLKQDLGLVLDELDELEAARRKARRHGERSQTRLLEDDILDKENQSGRFQTSILRSEAAFRPQSLWHWYPESVVRPVWGGSEIDGFVTLMRQRVSPRAIRPLVQFDRQLLDFDISKERSTGLFRRPRGVGNAASVYIASDSEGREWVLKEIDINSDFEEDAIRLHSCRHPLLTPLEAVFYTADKAYLQMPFYSHGNWREWMDDMQRPVPAEKAPWVPSPEDKRSMHVAVRQLFQV